MNIEDKFIEGILAETFRRIDLAYNDDNTATKLIFPETRNKENKKRVSEQELRFVFVEVLTEQLKKYPYNYSVETPSQYLYRFSTHDKPCTNQSRCGIDCKKESEIPHLCSASNGGNSCGSILGYRPVCSYGDTANFDLVLHDKDNTSQRLAWIEFKANNCSKEDIAKDYLKLSFEATNGPSYFVQLLPSSSKLSNIAEKAYWAINPVLKEHSREDCYPKHIIHVLSHEPNTEGKNFQYNYKKASFEEVIITHQK